MTSSKTLVAPISTPDNRALRQHVTDGWRTFVLAVLLLAANRVPAGDRLWHLTNGYEYSLAIGTVVDVAGDSFLFEVGSVVAGPPIDTTLTLSGAHLRETGIELHPGLHLVLPVNKETRRAFATWGVEVVSSTNSATLKVLAGLVDDDMAALQHYINTGGMDRDFFGIRENMYLRRRDGSVIRIFPVGADSIMPPGFPKQAEGGEARREVLLGLTGPGQVPSEPKPRKRVDLRVILFPALGVLLLAGVLAFLTRKGSGKLKGTNVA